MCHWRCFLRHGWRGTCIFASCHCFKEMKRPDSKRFPTYFGWLYCYPGYPESLKHFKNQHVQKMSQLEENLKLQHTLNNLQVVEWSMWFLAFVWNTVNCIIFSTDRVYYPLVWPLKFMKIKVWACRETSNIQNTWYKRSIDSGFLNGTSSSNWINIHMTCTFEMNLSKQNPTRSQQWFHSIHTYTDLYFLRGASRPLFKDPSSIEKNRAVLRVKAKDLASIGSKSPYLSDHEDDVKALGRQLFRLMGLRRFDSPFDRDGSLTFLYHPRMVNLGKRPLWYVPLFGQV